MNSLPFISVIIAVHNRAQTVEQALESVLSQTYPHKELLVIDGGSTDGSVEIIRQKSEHISYWISEPDRGIYNAWNKALEQIKGDWVIFLGADDYFWNERVLEEASSCLSRLESNVGICYGLVNLVNNDGEVLSTAGNEWNIAKLELKYRTSIPHTGTFHRSRLFKEYGKFDERFKILSDYDFFVRVLNKGAEDACFCNNLIVAAMRYGGVSSSFKTARLKLKEDYLVKKKNELSVLNYYWLRKVFITFSREVLIALVGEKRAEKTERKLRKRLKRQLFWDNL